MSIPPSPLLRAVWMLGSAALWLGACGIDAHGDDDGADDTSAAAAPTSTGLPADTSRSVADRGETVVTGDSGTGATTIESGGVQATVCGWGPTGEMPVQSGYVLGGDGEDPSGLMPLACPDDVPLVAGGECGGDMGITGVGCCDGAGAAWFCADDGRGPTLFTDHP